MSLWGASSLVAAALLSFSPGAHTAPSQHASADTPAVQTVALSSRLSSSPSPSPSPSSSPPTLVPTAASAAPVLQQVGGTTWQTTVLLSGSPGSCPLRFSDYELATTSPSLLLRPDGNAHRVTASPGHSQSCEVTLTFTSARLERPPATAALVLDGTTPLPLAVARSVTLFYYLAVPAIFGVVLAALLMGLCLALLKIYNRGGAEREPPFKRWRVNHRYWQHQIYASGAWTLNDSWATNVVAAVALVGTVLTIIPATDLLFRGVELDRFAVLNAVAAGIAAAAPLVFGIRYARWQHRYRGVTDDATLALPPEGRPYRLINLPGLTMPVRLAAGTVVVLPAGTPLYPAPPHSQPPDGRLRDPARARLKDAVEVTLAAPATARPTARTKVVLPAGLTVALPPGKLVLADGTEANLPGHDGIGQLPVGAAADLRAEDWLRLQVTDPAMPGYPLPVLPSPDGCPGVVMSCTSGAVITAPWGATVLSQDTDVPQGAHLETVSKLEVPPGTAVCILANKVTLPGAADIVVQSPSAIYLSHDDLTAVLTIPASDVSAPKDHPSDDVSLPFPVCVVPAAGAKVTATGIAQVDLPSGTTVTVPYGAPEDQLKPERLHFRLPQGPNSLAGTLAMVLTAAMVTMFGAGAELGVLTVLTVWYSELSLAGLVAVWMIVVLIALFTLAYSLTAIRSLADPQPGSSMSSTAGTSFTL